MCIRLVSAEMFTIIIFSVMDSDLESVIQPVRAPILRYKCLSEINIPPNCVVIHRIGVSMQCPTALCFNFSVMIRVTLVVFKDRVCRFGGLLSKCGLSLELNIHFMNAIHQFEGNY